VLWSLKDENELLESSPICEGIVPLSFSMTWLKVVKRVSLPISVGIVPDMCADDVSSRESV